jgi:hypothetical protein
MSLRDQILSHFGKDFTPFFHRFFEDLKPGGAGNLKALCPFHEDKAPSLSISIQDGRWNCKACGSKGDAFSFYARKNDLDIKGQFPEVLRGIAEAFGIQGGNGAGKTGAPRRIVKIYDYKDATNSVVSRKLRYEPKSFSLCRPDGSGGWINDLAGLDPVLYQLPEVLAADEVFIPEGEKDCDSLATLGITATTNFDGAGKWRESYTETLAGKRCIIIPDRDEPGRKHADLVARSLHGKAAWVGILELPAEVNGRPVKDASDFILAIGDPAAAAEQLGVLAEAAVEWTPKAEQESPPDPEGAADKKPEQPAKFKFIHNAEILKNLKPIEWRIRDVLVEKSFYYNFGDSGHYKTFVELDRCLCIAAGIDYHGHPVKQGTVFYIAGEGQQGIGRRIAVWHALHGTKAAEVPFFISETATQLMDPGAVDEIRKAVDQMAAKYGPPALIAIDTLARNFGEGDENATKDMNRVISNMDSSFRNDFLRSLNHHTGLANKERARGSYALHCAADSAFRVSLTDQGQVLVECLKMKDAKPAPAMLFDRREVLLDIEGTPDRSFVLELAAEGDEALELSKSEQPGKVRGKTKSEALDILRGMYADCRCNLDSSGRPNAMGHVTEKAWREACFAKGLFGARKNNFDRTAENLLKDKLIQYDKARFHVYLFGQIEQTEQF